MIPLYTLVLAVAIPCCLATPVSTCIEAAADHNQPELVEAEQAAHHIHQRHRHRHQPAGLHRIHSPWVAVGIAEAVLQDTLVPWLVVAVDTAVVVVEAAAGHILQSPHRTQASAAAAAYMVVAVAWVVEAAAGCPKDPC